MIQVVLDATAPSTDTYWLESSTEQREYRKRPLMNEAQTRLSRQAQPGSSIHSASSLLPDHQALAELREQARWLFRVGRWEEFETGTESRLARGIQGLVQQHSGAGPDVVKELILAGEVETETAWEALRWLGSMQHLPSRAARLWILEQCLQSPAAKVRDGAALGLAAMDDPHAIPTLMAAAATEHIPELRDDLLQVLHQLESTARCPSS